MIDYVGMSEESDDAADQSRTPEKNAKELEIYHAGYEDGLAEDSASGTDPETLEPHLAAL
mgnify:CR=1 FL=1